MYVVNNWNEVEKYLDTLEKGNDVLKEKRKKFIYERYKEDVLNSAENIVETVASDYYNNGLKENTLPL